MKINKCGYIIGALMLVLGLHSCQKTETVDGGERYPILFGSAETRAAAGLDNLKEDGFKVYAFIQGNAGSSSFEKKVTYTASQNVWGYEPLEYWIPSTTYYFKAFYPAAPTAGTLIVDNTTKEQNFTITGFNISEQEDVLMASAKRVVNAAAIPTIDGEETQSVVNLNFQHLLACIEIEIVSNIDVTIQEITFGNLANLYQCNDGTWVKGSGNMTDYTIKPNKVLTSSPTPVEVTGGILVIPAMTGSETVTIKTSSKTYENIPLAQNIEWQAGNKYTYRAEIKQSDIIFNKPKSKVWDSESATGSVIIK